MNDDQASPGIKQKAANLKEGVKDVKDKAVHAWEKTRDTASTVKETVSAFVDESKKQDVVGKSKEAIQKAGETTREVSTAAREEVQHTKDSLHSPPAEAPKVGSGSSTTTTRDQIDTTSY